MATAFETPASALPPAAAVAIPTFNPGDLMDLYLTGRFDDLSEHFLGILAYFEKMRYQILASRQEQYFVNAFVKVFLNLFTQPDYVLSEQHIVPFLSQNLTISNLTAVSSFGTTDAFLALLADQKANFSKTLTLYSARNSLKFDRRQICDRLAAADLQSTVFDGSAAHYFREAIDYLIVHHDRLQSETDRRPIRIGAT
jgi:hypothetical protein